MVFVLLVWVLGLLLIVPAGIAMRKLLGGSSLGPFTDDFFEVFTLGLFAHLSVCMTLSIVLPMNVFSLALSVLFSLVCAYYAKFKFKDYWVSWQSFCAQRSTWQIIFLCAAILLALIWSVSIERDNGMNSIYHLQTLLWNNEYPVVPGLANLNSRLGYNHSLLVFESLLQVPFQSFTIADDFNGLLFLVFSVYLSRGFMEPEFRHRLALIPLLPLGFIFIATATPELLVAVYIAYLLIYLLESKGNTGNKLSYQFILIVLTVVMVITVKLSALSLASCGITAAIIYRKDIDISRIVLLAGFIAAICFPWLARYQILTGYLIYPFYQLDFFNSDWKMPMSILSYEQHINTIVAKTSGFSASDDWNIEGKGFLFWFVPWLKGKSVGYLAVLGLFVSNLFFSIWGVFRNNLRTSVLLWVSWIISISVVFWFVQSPNMRYVIGYGWATLAVLYLLVSQEFPLKVLNKWMPHLACVVMMSFAIFAIASKKYAINFITQAPYHQPDIIMVQTGRMKIAIPVKPEIGCWNTPLPCSDTLFTNLEPRGATLRDGFRIVSKPTNE